jgi:hypothetical protein
LTYATAATLYSGRDNGNTARWYTVPRITYELQDLADVHASSWQFSNWSLNWTTDKQYRVLLESPIVDENGQIEVPAGLQLFYLGSRDRYVASQTDGRETFINKKWFWGAYTAERDPDDIYPKTDDCGGYSGQCLDTVGWSRAAVSGYYDSHGSYWWQHDYFAHDGLIDSRDHRESGAWLTGPWYRPENGGFDGRWAQLFDDRPSYEATAPLSLSVNLANGQCTEEAWATAYVTGGQGPYSFSWSGASPYSAANDSPNTAFVPAYTNATVTATSADGQSSSTSVYFQPDCGGGGYQ